MADLMLRNESDRTRVIGYLHSVDLTKPKKLSIKDEKDRKSVV